MSEARAPYHRGQHDLPAGICSVYDRCDKRAERTGALRLDSAGHPEATFGRVVSLLVHLPREVPFSRLTLWAILGGGCLVGIAAIAVHGCYAWLRSAKRRLMPAVRRRADR